MPGRAAYGRRPGPPGRRADLRACRRSRGGGAIGRPVPGRPAPRRPQRRPPEPRQPEPRQPEPRQPEPRQPEPRQPEPRQPEPRQPEPRQPEPVPWAREAVSRPPVPPDDDAARAAATAEPAPGSGWSAWSTTRAGDQGPGAEAGETWRDSAD